MKPMIASAIAAALLAGSAATAPLALAAGKAPPAAGGFFQVHPKVADTEGAAPVTDPDLVNPWGIAQGSGGPIWTANNHSSTSTVYDRRTYDKQALTVSIPAAGGGSGGSPTGAVFVQFGGPDFPVSNGASTGGAYFLFVTEDGTISGWNPQVDSTHALIAVDDSDEGASYKGASVGDFQGHRRLFVADFANNEVGVYDADFSEAGHFTDPNLPAGYAPFNVQVLNNKVYVAYALRDPGTGDEVAGPGNGFVDVFQTSGAMVGRLVSGGHLDAPWGMAIAPDGFGKFAGQLLVGNFGDGRINVYDKSTGAYLGKLRGADGKAIVIDGLWAIFPGPGQTLSFAAGTHDEEHGLLGQIDFSLSK
jgi:uncharacterized protein (TIGR03118 family)